MKYLRTFLLALQAEFLSRMNIFGWFITGLVPAFSLILVWFAILGENQSVNGFTRGDFIIYYLFMTLSWYIVGGTFGQQLGYNFKSGLANTALLKPYNVVLAQALSEQAWKVLSLTVSVPCIALLFWLFSPPLQNTLTIATMVQLMLSLILGGIIFGFLQALVGISSFWITEVWAMHNLNDVLTAFFGGQYIPLALLPTPVLTFASFLPFKYTFYTPVSILLGKSSAPWMDLGIQAVFVVILYATYTIAWRLGIKKYEAVGA